MALYNNLKSMQVRIRCAVALSATQTTSTISHPLASKEEAPHQVVHRITWTTGEMYRLTMRKAVSPSKRVRQFRVAHAISIMFHQIWPQISNKFCSISSSHAPSAQLSLKILPIRKSNYLNSSKIRLLYSIQITLSNSSLRLKTSSRRLLEKALENL